MKKLADIAGIGIGVFNLSLATLLQKSNLTYRFFDKKVKFNWHKGMLIDDTQLQTHFLKDLASCVDPCNPYTFLSYLTDKKRIYQFLNKKNHMVSRCEFNQYFQWAAERIPHLNFNENVLTIFYKKNLFEIVTNQRTAQSQHLVIGTGIRPFIPKKFKKFLSDRFFHNSEFLQRIKTIDFSNQKIAIIGGGQSGAEIFNKVISMTNQPKSITWISKRSNFRSLEDNCFINEYFTPHYVKYFYALLKEKQQQKLNEQYLASDGITESLINTIYNKLYELNYVDHSDTDYELVSNHCLQAVSKKNHHYQLIVFDEDLQQYVDYEADIVILATGYHSNLPSFLQKLLPESYDLSRLPLNEDYSLNWEHGETNKIFIQNGAKHSHGISDPNLSLVPWRNAIIINSLMNRNFYDIDMTQPLVWRKKNQRSDNYVRPLIEAMGELIIS